MGNFFDVGIIGGGPSGMMAAITAANKRSVILFEKNESLGRKILATGNGRCNLTNRFAESSRYHGGNSEFVESVLKSFDQFEAMKFFENLGIVLKEEDNGRIFPRSNQAQTVVDALTHELNEKNVFVKTSAQVKKILKESNGFKIVLGSGEEYSAKKIIIACGGKAAQHLGSTGDGYYWAELFGHKITPTFPALVPMETVEDWPQKISGLRVEGISKVSIDGKIVSEKEGDILFTHFGLSAPSIMFHATNIGPHIGKEIKVHLDLFPDKNEKELDTVLANVFQTSGSKQLKNALSGIIPNNLAPVILDLENINKEKKTAEISKADRQKIVKALKNLTLTVKQLRPFKEAQVTRGGVDLDQINPQTLESKIVSDLYFAGEILDVNGDSGGFNLQWAWSSGNLSGRTL